MFQPPQLPRDEKLIPTGLTVEWIGIIRDLVSYGETPLAMRLATDFPDGHVMKHRIEWLSSRYLHLLPGKKSGSSCMISTAVAYGGIHALEGTHRAPAFKRRKEKLALELISSGALGSVCQGLWWDKLDITSVLTIASAPESPPSVEDHRRLAIQLIESGSVEGRIIDGEPCNHHSIPLEFGPWGRVTSKRPDGSTNYTFKRFHL